MTYSRSLKLLFFLLWPYKNMEEQLHYTSCTDQTRLVWMNLNQFSKHDRLGGYFKELRKKIFLRKTWRWFYGRENGVNTVALLCDQLHTEKLHLTVAYLGCDYRAVSERNGVGRGFISPLQRIIPMKISKGGWGLQPRVPQPWFTLVTHNHKKALYRNTVIREKNWCAG